MRANPDRPEFQNVAGASNRRFLPRALFFGLLALLCALGGSSRAAADPESASPTGAQTISSDERIDRAKRLARDGRAEEAIAILDAVIAAAPIASATPTAFAMPARGDEALFQKGLILFTKLKRHGDAIAALSDLVRLFPDSPYGDDALYYAGFVAQFHLRDPDRAVELYRLGYTAYPSGDYRFAIADKIRELTGAAPETARALERDVAERARGVAMEGVTVSGRADTASGARRAPPETDIADTSPFRPRNARTVTVQFEKAPLRTFIQWVAQVTGRNFIVDDEIAGEITVYSGRPVPFDEVYRIFLSILEVKGFAAVESGDVVKIVSRQTAATSELPIVLDDEAFVPTDRVVTRIFRFRTVAAASVQNLLRPLLASTDQVILNPDANSLIVTGPGSNIAKIAELVRIIESERTPLGLQSHRLRHARAAAVVEKLTGILSAMAPAGVQAPVFRLVPDERTNTLHVLGDERVHAEVRGLLRDLDDDRAVDRIMKVYSLSYAKADEAVKQLKALMNLDAIDQAPDFGGVTQTILIADLRLNAISLATYSSRVVETVDSYLAQVDRPPSDLLRSMHIVRLQNAQAVKLAETLSKLYAPAAAGAATPAGAGDAATTGLADKVIITSDERTNSLLVTATQVDWEKLERVIRDLDVRKTQVLIDAVVLETNLDEARALGASLMTADEPEANKTIGFARSDPVGFLPTYQALAAQGGLTIGAARGSIVAAMLNALLTSSKTNVLQMPQILALDNEIATLSVGNLTPIVTSRSVSGENVQIGGSSSIFQNVEYRNIGLNLKIKPHIGDRGDILIESRIEIQNRNVQAEAGINLPVFTTREIEQKFQITDGDYIVLGGLLRTQDESTQRETPWLARIPILGTLFKFSRSSESKTVLLIFLRPRVVTDPAAARTVSEEERLQYEAESRTRPGAPSTEADKWLAP
jgi:general secretion pathway protein D